MRTKKLNHAGSATSANPQLLGQPESVNRVGSGEWLGHWYLMSSCIFITKVSKLLRLKPGLEQTLAVVENIRLQPTRNLTERELIVHQMLVERNRCGVLKVISFLVKAPLGKVVYALQLLRIIARVCVANTRQHLEEHLINCGVRLLEIVP